MVEPLQGYVWLSTIRPTIPQSKHAEAQMKDNQSPTPHPQSPHGPLHGIRVVECGQMVGAAYAAKLMADLGAEVIKVEEPAGDPARRRGPYPGQVPHLEKSGLFLYLNTNKLGVTLNLQT